MALGPIDAVVFDFDGVIVDSERANHRAWIETFERYGAAFSLEEWCTRIGTDGGFSPHAALPQRCAEALPERDVWLAEKQARQMELLLPGSPLPGVRSWLEDAEDHGVQVAIASSSPAAWIEDLLERIGLRDRFDVIVCAGDGIPAKPAPDVYLAACAALGVEARRSLAIEDSPNGAVSAIAAGLRCVVVPHEITGHLPFHTEAVVVESLETFTLRDAARTLPFERRD